MPSNYRQRSLYHSAIAVQHNLPSFAFWSRGEMIILIITVHIARVSMANPRVIVDLARMVPHYAARALDDDLPLSARREAAGVGALLRDVLGVYEDAQLVRSSFGKPELADANAPSISISHAAGTAVLAVSEAAQLSGGPIGVDIESMGEVSPLAVSRMATFEERAWIDAAGNQRERCRRMCRVWTRIEAVLKAQGSGFSVDPGMDGLPDGWNVSFTEYDGSVISCAAHFVPQIVLKEHIFHVG